MPRTANKNPKAKPQVGKNKNSAAASSKVTSTALSTTGPVPRMTRSTRAAGGTRDAPVPAKASSTAPSPSALTKQTNNSDGSRVGAVVKVESLAVLRRRQSEQSRLLASVLDGTKEGSGRVQGRLQLGWRSTREPAINSDRGSPEMSPGAAIPADRKAQPSGADTPQSLLDYETPPLLPVHRDTFPPRETSLFPGVPLHSRVETPLPFSPTNSIILRTLLFIRWTMNSIGYLSSLVDPLPLTRRPHAAHRLFRIADVHTDASEVAKAEAKLLSRWEFAIFIPFPLRTAFSGKTTTGGFIFAPFSLTKRPGVREGCPKAPFQLFTPSEHASSATASRYCYLCFRDDASKYERPDLTNVLGNCNHIFWSE
ncbi:hypothetical protein A1Q1_03212 [Trichosporon asahii var. asahii CBS 2479]|uniref:Uncharacterized protein n=1 Tax=Trichosporon asahii var. asahii (strain ATCC 90039 / CBS 2479 / JCM 2466 / KCTC 7840 / NBRC 103889/ NCYC 2677 / UAMH 7654) TaxID=1186058 RepID=J5SWI2_TRIAS|nr:hypothetical protein A1Q1_03212 [Trichosporon asahii var. asahii CBS 2479]EJT47906.1 hypothetical protein A1Q1_03212 [Trichosporon asahii var. asahii CBS 2479]